MITDAKTWLIRKLKQLRYRAIDNDINTLRWFRWYSL